jgi:hypothetical protein
MCNKNIFFDDFGLLIVKNNLPIQFAKSVWFKHLTYVQELIPFIREFSQEI